jgi:hypothetical protein
VIAPTITEADRATARRVIRRHVDSPKIVVSPRPAHIYGPAQSVCLLPGVWDAAVLAAAQGRAYAKALREAT